MQTAVRSLFHQVSGLPKAEQQAALARASRRDPQTAYEVQRLLGYCSESAVFECEVTGPRSLAVGDPVAQQPESSSSSPGAHGPVAQPDSWRASRTVKSLLVIVLTFAGAGLLIILSWRETRERAQEAVGASLRAASASRASAVQNWLQAEERLVLSWASHPDLLPLIRQLNIDGNSEDPQQALCDSEALQELRRHLHESAHGVAFAIWNREGVLLADSCEEHFEFLGNGTTEYGASLLSRVLGHGETVLWLPTGKGFITEGFELKGETTEPGIAFLTPIRGASGRPVAAALFASQRYQETLDQTLIPHDNTGIRTYAVDRDGVVFGGSVSLWGQAGDSLQNESVQRAVELKDGVVEPNGARPLSRAAAACVAGDNGTDCTGYLDPRGVPVCGSWQWIDERRFGVIAESDQATALQAADTLRNLFLQLTAILVAGSIVGFVVYHGFRYGDRVPSLDGYILQTRIGEGGFAEVWKARHRQLRRTVAVKILRTEQCNLQNISRFEREVRLACRLRNPNTISIHDWGKTRDGQSYCVMEYLHGFTLQELVQNFGAVCEPRTVWILTCVCQSLNEAHSDGLVHRDVKPQNVMLCEQGGAFDLVKVVDFGLARNPNDSVDDQITQTHHLIGTPMYMPPERVLDPTCIDPRSDVYAVGLLGCFLLTGAEPHDSVTSIDALMKLVETRVPSVDRIRGVSPELSRLINDCVQPDPGQRPSSASEVLERLVQLRLPQPWNPIRAEAWWRNHAVPES